LPISLSATASFFQAASTAPSASAEVSLAAKGEEKMLENTSEMGIVDALYRSWKASYHPSSTKLLLLKWVQFTPKAAACLGAAGASHCWNIPP